MIFVGLTQHLSGAPWGASDEGRDFVTLSSERWFEADVAAGTDEATARAAADKTTAFYTEMPEVPDGEE